MYLQEVWAAFKILQGENEGRKETIIHLTTIISSVKKIARQLLEYF